MNYYTLKMFIENVSRLEIYITELKDDFVNVKIIDATEFDLYGEPV